MKQKEKGTLKNKQKCSKETTKIVILQPKRAERVTSVNGSLPGMPIRREKP